MKFVKTKIPDVILIKPDVYEDDRGFFMETYHEKKFIDAGINYTFVQDNQSRSIKGTLRGLHYQIYNSQGKLVRVSIGEIFDVAIDIRKSSPTFGNWIGNTLNAENKYQLWIPPGFAHGFYTISDWAEVIYKTTDFYTPDAERTLIWNDPEININWPFGNKILPILSAKDAKALSLEEAEVFD